jgi:NAD(P)-dependent dehydrogenase (short-subunit alcohol dehydrogenase family)
MAKLALITGASRGIGKALAKGLHQDGWKIVLVARNEKKLNSLAKSLNSKSSKKKAWVYAGDVSDRKFVKATVKEVLAKIGTPDLLINGAAINHHGTLTVTHDQFEEQMAVNVAGAFNFLKALVPAMKKRGSGYIINISSIAGKVGFAGSGSYVTTKFALNGLSESLFHELVPEGIKVTSICPSWVDTDMAAYSGIPGDEMIHVKDILKTVRYLLDLGPNAVPKEVVISCVPFI